MSLEDFCQNIESQDKETLDMGFLNLNALVELEGNGLVLAPGLLYRQGCLCLTTSNCSGLTSTSSGVMM